MRTWKVIVAGEGFAPTSEIPLDCPGCGKESLMPYAPMEENPIIASWGLNLVFDMPGRKPPETMLPHTIQCRHCRRMYESKDANE